MNRLLGEQDGGQANGWGIVFHKHNFYLCFIWLCLVLLASHFLCVFEHGLILFSLGTQYHQVPHHQNHRELKNREVEIVMCHKTQQIVQVVSELVLLFIARMLDATLNYFSTRKICNIINILRLTIGLDKKYF